MRFFLLIISILLGVTFSTEAVGTMSSVYLDPVGGDDNKTGTLLYPVKTWDKALSLAADNATIFVTWGSVPVTSNTTLDGNQYGATNITVMPNTGYTGALFTIADGATGTFANMTLKGLGTAQALLTVNSGGSIAIGSNLGITDGGQIALDGGARPIKLDAVPPSGMSYELLTTYQYATDEGRAIVNVGSVSNPLQYFTLIEPTATANVAYELGLDGTIIRLYERAIGGVYLDPLNGNDSYSGAKSSRPVKTLAKAIALWNNRSVIVPDITIYVLTRITLTENLTLDNGIKFTRFAGDSDRSVGMTDYMFVFSGYQLTINDATLINGSISGIMLYSESYGILTLNNGATLTSANTSNIIESRTYGTITMNAGATITSTGTNGYAISVSSTSAASSSTNIIINGGTITTSGNGIYKYYATLTIHDITMKHTGSNYCIYNYYGTSIIHDGIITTKGNNAIYNYYGALTINGGNIKNERTSTGYTVVNASSAILTINGGVIDGGKTTAVYNTSTSGMTINGSTISSTNTANGTIHSLYMLRLNGENVAVTGPIYQATTSLENYYIAITSPTVTQNYTLRVMSGAPYTALVRSNPSIDLGLYESHFTLEPKDGYLLAAYASKGQGNKNLVLYNSNGIYVNDYNGNDANTGTSPALPLKTLAYAATKTTATKTSIYICDSTLTINSAQNISQSAIKDTITSFMFRTTTHLMRITTGGSLTLGNIAVYTTSAYVNRYILMDNGTLTLNKGAELMTYGKQGIYQTGGDVVMKAGSLIKYHPTSTGVSGYGIYQTGSTATATLDSGAVIERQTYAIRIDGGSTVHIKDSAVIQNIYYALYMSGAGIVNIDKARIQGGFSTTSYQTVYINNGTVNLNGTIIRNSAYIALYISGMNTIVNMTDGQIINNGTQGTGSSNTYQGAVSIYNRATFNMSGGLIAENNIPSKTNNAIYGEQVYISTGGKMNFTGGTIAASTAKRNAVYVHTESTVAAQQTTRLTLGDMAVLDSGFIYCHNVFNAPIALSESLSATKKFNINLGDNMAGCVVVDGTSPGTFPASVNNFILNPEINTLSLSQSGNDVVVTSNAIYLNGINGNDANDGSSAAKAVKTFTVAKSRLISSGGDVIVIVGSALLNNTGESSVWDLSEKPNAVVRRGLGYTGYLVQIPSGYSLTLSDITFDGDKDNFNSGSAIIYNNGILTINPGTIIRNNYSYGVYNTNSSIYMNGGSIADNNSYGLYCTSSSSRSDEFIMTGGSITENSNAGVYSSYMKYLRLTGGEISKNGTYGIYNYYYHASGVWELGGTAKITENVSAGIYSYTSTYYLDSLIISGGEISNNDSYGGLIYVNNVSFTAGTINGNNGYGLSLHAHSSMGNRSFSMTGGTISNNASNGLLTNNYIDHSMKNAIINGNKGYGTSISNSKNLLIDNVDISNNNSYGISVSGGTNILVNAVNISKNGNHGMQISSNTITNQGIFTMTSGNINNNSGYGLSFNNSYIAYDISGDVQITHNKNSGIYSNTLLPSSISGNVVIKGNKTTNYGGGLYLNQGTVYISDNVLFEADTCTNYGGGAIYVATNGDAVISGNVKIKDCVNSTASTSTSYGGSAIYAIGSLSMKGGSITGCLATNTRGTIFVSGITSKVSLTRVNINNNTARYGGAVYVNTGGRITLDSDTINNNTTLYESYTSPVSGVIHLTGAATGRFALRDKCSVEGVIYINSIRDSVYIDEALLSASVGAFQLLGSTAVTVPGTVVVSPNGTTVTDASQFLSKFTLMNGNIGRGLDKGGTDDKHIIIVNQFFIDGTIPNGTNNGANPLTAFNKFSQLTTTIMNTAYTTVWVSGPVTVTGTDVLPTVGARNVNLRRYTGFAVAARAFPAYDSVMVTINPGASLTIPGGNSATNKFTISGEGGSSFVDASIFKNNGTLTIRGYTHLYFNPIAGDGAAVYQNGIFNLSGNVEFELYSMNTVYLPEDKVININGAFNSTTPVGITVETSPTNTHLPGRIVATGTITNVPVGKENLFYNEIATAPLPIGRSVSGTNAHLMFYIADRNVTGVPIYTTLQDAFDASVPANNDEVRLYGNTEESVLIDKTLKYNSQGHSVLGSFTMDSTSTVQLLDDLLADTLFIRTNTFSKKAQIDCNGYDVTLAKAAYFDYSFPDNASMSEWYPINLPFNANLSDIRNASDTSARLPYLQDYAIATFDGQRRANFGIGNQPSNPENDWQYFTDAKLKSGIGYMATTKGIRTLRFKAADLSLFGTTTVPMMYYVGGAGTVHQGLNYIPQPMGVNSLIGADIPNGKIIQVSESLSSDRIGSASYVAKTVSPSLVVAPYTNYFYQTNVTGTVSYTKSTLPATVKSGKRALSGSSDFEEANTAYSSEVPSYYELRLFADDPDRYDALFVAASEYASKDRYEIGRDVIKMGTTGTAAQLWSYNYDVALCATEVLLEDGRAEIPMFIHTPVAGKEYTLQLGNVVTYSEQLWLCRDKKPVQNLTEYPEYVIEGTGNTTDEYSLRLITGMTANEGVAGEIYVYTENKTIIITGLPQNGEYMLFDMSGRLLAKGKSEGERIRVHAERGTYVVQINNQTYKAVVK